MIDVFVIEDPGTASAPGGPEGMMMDVTKGTATSGRWLVDAVFRDSAGGVDFAVEPVALFRDRGASSHASPLGFSTLAIRSAKA
jgi:hypothetical protein